MNTKKLEDIGLYYFKDILPAELQTELLAWLCSKHFTPAFGTSGRVVCQFGYEYQYTKRDVKPSSTLR